MKLVWAFNPFDDNPGLRRNSLTLLRAVRRPGDTLEAVFVASPGEVQLAYAFQVPAAQRYTTHARELCAERLAGLGVTRAKLTVLGHRERSVTASARVLAEHLVDTRADLALVSSHARKGLSKLLLGSFAETLVHLSRTDLLLFNDRSRIAELPRTLLFASDLSPQADAGLRRALRYARHWRAELHVIHAPRPDFGFKVEQGPEVERYRKDVVKRIQRIERRLERSGVAGSAVVDDRWQPVSRLILGRAKQVNADVVLTVAKTGRLAGLIGGSVTRQVLRGATVPVLVIK
jgi:nucleotide-binding universal stress UspA family protein